MGSDHFAEAQRLAFGRVADLYDRARPSYPQVVIDEVIEFARLRPPARILEVGAGTGKATVLFADRGLGVLALEPSHEMAQVARANCRRYPNVEIIEAEFERWHPTERLPALVAGLHERRIHPAAADPPGPHPAPGRSPCGTAGRHR